VIDGRVTDYFEWLSAGFAVPAGGESMHRSHQWLEKNLLRLRRPELLHQNRPFDPERGEVFPPRPAFSYNLSPRTNIGWCWNGWRTASGAASRPARAGRPDR